MHFLRLAVPPRFLAARAMAPKAKPAAKAAAKAPAPKVLRLLRGAADRCSAADRAELIRIEL